MNLLIKVKILTNKPKNLWSQKMFKMCHNYNKISFSWAFCRIWWNKIPILQRKFSPLQSPPLHLATSRPRHLATSPLRKRKKLLFFVGWTKYGVSGKVVTSRPRHVHLATSPFSPRHLATSPPNRFKDHLLMLAPTLSAQSCSLLKNKVKQLSLLWKFRFNRKKAALKLMKYVN